MGRFLTFIILCFVFAFSSKSNAEDNVDFTQSIRMPSVVVHEPDSLICTGVKLPPEESYLVKYTPHVSKTTAHHMSVFGCLTMGSDEKSWECGHNQKTSKHICGHGKNHYLFVWALNAPVLELPQGVGFRVGGTTKWKYVVVQIHYARKFVDGETDSSGITLHLTHNRKPQQLGFYIMGNSGKIPPQKEEVHLESACHYHGKDTIYPVKYRTHTHELGVVISAYRIRDGKWMEIGRNSPQLPQTFYDVTNPGMDIRPGDILATRCTMNSMSRTDITHMGPTHHEEMCVFYVMYATDDIERELSSTFCFRYSPKFMWNTSFMKKYLPVPSNASSLDGIANADYVRKKMSAPSNHSSP